MLAPSHRRRSAQLRRKRRPILLAEMAVQGMTLFITGETVEQQPRRRRRRRAAPAGRLHSQARLGAPGVLGQLFASGSRGNADASSTAIAHGSGKASSSASATGGGFGHRPRRPPPRNLFLPSRTFQSADEAVDNSSAGDGVAATADAVAQAGGVGRALVKPDEGAYAFSSVRPDKADATTLIGGASAVASTFLGADDTIFGTVLLGADSAGPSSTASSTFDFHLSRRSSSWLDRPSGFQSYGQRRQSSRGGFCRGQCV